MAAQTPHEVEGIWEDRGTDTERLVFFSDAVFAIAMTLLIIDIHVPEAGTPQELWNGLLQLWPHLLGFVISFFVISMYWRNHHRMFHFIKRYDRTLINLNFALLFLIVLLPFTTALISLHGDWQLPVAIYDSSLALAGLIMAAIWVYATSGGRLVDAGLESALGAPVYVPVGLYVARVPDHYCADVYHPFGLCAAGIVGPGPRAAPPVPSAA